MAENYIMIDLNDERTAGIADVISNKTCKRILELLSEKELSEGDIAKELKIPLNTAEYNLKKLVESGLIEKSKNFFWSMKGKKVVVYKISNKKIVISPRSIIRGVLPSALITGLIAVSIKIYSDSARVANKVYDAGVSVAESAKSVGEIASDGGVNVLDVSYPFASFPEYWAWFLLGALTALFVYVVWNWRKL